MGWEGAGGGRNLVLGAQAHFCSSHLSLGAGLQKGTQSRCLPDNPCISSPNSGSTSRPHGSHFRQPLSPSKMLPGKWCFSDPQNEEVLLTIQPPMSPVVPLDLLPLFPPWTRKPSVTTLWVKNVSVMCCFFSDWAPFSAPSLCQAYPTGSNAHRHA